MPQLESTPIPNEVFDFTEAPPILEQQGSCVKCYAEFGRIICRRTICTTCHSCFCPDHCNRHLTVMGVESKGPVALCENCYKKYSNVDLSRPYSVIAPQRAANGHTVLLLHAGGGHRMNLVRQAKDLVTLGYRAVLVDLPGHGAREPQELSLHSALAALQHVVDAEVPDTKFLLLGFYTGAYVAAAYAARHRARLHALLLLACGVEYTPRPKSLVALGVAYRATPDAALARLLRTQYGSIVPPELLYEASERGGVFYKAWDGVMDAMGSESIVANLNAVGELPVLILNGEKDRRVDEAAIAAAALNSTLKVVPCAPHPVHLTHPLEVERALRKFLSFLNPQRQREEDASPSTPAIALSPAPASAPTSPQGPEGAEAADDEPRVSATVPKNKEAFPDDFFT